MSNNQTARSKGWIWLIHLSLHVVKLCDTLFTHTTPEHLRNQSGSIYSNAEMPHYLLMGQMPFLGHHLSNSIHITPLCLLWTNYRYFNTFSTHPCWVNSIIW